MTRSRKREVLKNKVQRAAQVLRVTFTDIERAVYRRVTSNIREQSVGRDTVSQFALIMRQRQMASSQVAAIESWKDKGHLDDLLWEDLGHRLSLEEERIDDLDAPGAPRRDFDGMRTGNGLDEVVSVQDMDIETLEAVDGKYSELFKFLTNQLRTNPQEKFVVFAFFRGTLHYLARRLRRDGIPVVLIMGGMGEEKYIALRQFREPSGPPVLLSSEIGSEGIDLEHCRFVVNYDLPWNPMLVEQRIGRLDRLGQEADKISIINIAVVDTIEDRILLRLYDRIRLFEESVGDLESILGEATERLLLV